MNAEKMSAGRVRYNGMAMACIQAWEKYYCWSNRLLPIGPLFLVGQKSYLGETRTFADETVLAEGDRVGSIHLNNLRVSSIGCETDRHRTAWQFTRMLRASLEALAQFSMSESGTGIAVYQGTTWMQPHGLHVGFTTEPLTEGFRTQLLRWQFRILRACFAPASFGTRESPTPRHFWITRTQLRNHFGADAGMAGP